MRFLLAGVVLAAVAYGAWQSARPEARRPTAAAKSAREIDECRDRCEQQQIVSAGSDDERRACRARCGDPTGAAPPPHEVPSRITVSPAVLRPKVYSPPAQLPLAPATPR